MAYFTDDCQEAEPGDNSKCVASTTNWFADIEENFVASWVSTKEEKLASPLIDDCPNVARLKEMLLSEVVPSVLCLVRTSGLPESSKSSTIKVFLDKIILKKRENSSPGSLSASDCTVLSRHPDRNFLWMPSTKRCGVVACVLSHLVRCDALHDQLFSVQQLPVPDTSLKLFESPLLNAHFHWVHKETMGNYNVLWKKKGAERAFFRSGFSFIRVWDVDTNEVVYEFLGKVARCFHRSLVLTFFDLDRDAPNFQKPFKLGEQAQKSQHSGQLLCWRPRIQYLLRFAAPGHWLYDKVVENTTLMIATTKDDAVNDRKLKAAKEVIMNAARQQQIGHVIRDEFVGLKIGKDEDLKKTIEYLEKVVYYNLRYTVHLPLKWIFLRSALASEANPELFVPTKYIRDLSKELYFTDDEFKEFLDTFTSFGSILYSTEYSPLTSHVLTDVPKFCEILNCIYYPQSQGTRNVSRYGIISKEKAIKIIEETHADHCMSVLVSLGMAAEVGKDRLILEDCKQHEASYFLPSARIGAEDKQLEHCPDGATKDFDSAYIVVEPEHIMPLDYQATLAHFILKEIPGLSLVATKSFNTTSFKSNDGMQVTLVFHNDSVELKVENILASFDDKVNQLLVRLLRSCKDAVTRFSKHVKSLSIHIGLPCTCSAQPTLQLLENEETCSICNEKSPLRQCWIEAAKQVNENLPLADIADVAEKLADSAKLTSHLELTEEQKQKLTGLTASKLQSGSTVDTAVQADYFAVAPDFLRGVEVYGETVLEVVGNKPQKLIWPGYGFYIEVSEGTLPPGVTASVGVKIILKGQFKLPEESRLISAVYWISSSEMFLKEVAVSIQHCAVISSEEQLSKCKFIIAKCSQEVLPYRFKKKDGLFNVYMQYATIKLKQFSLVGATGPEDTKLHYMCLKFYKPIPHTMRVDFFFVVIRNLEAELKSVTNVYSDCKEDKQTQMIVFEKDEITLDLPCDPTKLTCIDKWKLLPLTYPKIAKVEVERFQAGTRPPTCNIELEWTGAEGQQQDLSYRVKIIGAEKPNNFFQMRYYPHALDTPVITHVDTALPTQTISQDASATTPAAQPFAIGTMLDHATLNCFKYRDAQGETQRIFITDEIAAKWKRIGLALKFTASDLENIESTCGSDVEKCINELLNRWLCRSSCQQPITWETLLEALRDARMGQLADKLTAIIT